MITPLSTAFVTASASAWVSVPAFTAASSLAFRAAARSACRAVRISSRAVVTLASSMPSFSARALARAASRSAGSGGVVLSSGFAVGRFSSQSPQRLSDLVLAHAQLAGQLGREVGVPEAVTVPASAGPTGPEVSVRRWRWLTAWA